MRLDMLLCFQWNVFNIHLQMLSDYTLIWFIEIKWHGKLITCMVKHRPLMYKKKCENTFEILRSERTFLMDLYIYCVKKYHVHFRIIYTMNAEDIFRSSIGCEIMLMIKARIRLIFSRYNMQ